MKKPYLIISFLLTCKILVAQDSTESIKKFELGGYIKDLQSLNFDKNFAEAISSNLLHNRINLKYRFSPKWSAVAEFRNRLFWGEEVKLTQGFSTLLKNKNEKLDLSLTLLDKKGLVLHSNIERLWLEFRKKKFNVRVGRQRINWVMTTTWNPNDIFNTYNFLDFDYEERPGSDALKFQYIINDFSNVEAVTAFSGPGNKQVSAIRYYLNRCNYDWQILGGWFRVQPVLGMGWAGIIKDAGFKGEVQYYFPTKDSLNHVNIATEVDYVFKDGWYCSAGFLFNSRGLTLPVENWDEVNLELSPRNLMPARWNFILNSSKEFTPLFNGSISVLYAPGVDMLILFPSLRYNLVTNLDVDLTWQSFFARLSRKFQAATHRVFIRIKWSF